MSEESKPVSQAASGGPPAARTIKEPRESWKTGAGLVFVIAGIAVGMGSFFRFSSNIFLNGGIAFVVPYFIMFLALGVPLMFVEWAMGRRGGSAERGSMPAIFDMIWKNPISKYLGVLGIALPLLFVVYFTYIESWALAYVYFSACGKCVEAKSPVAAESFFYGYTGRGFEREELKRISTGEIAVSKSLEFGFGKYYGDGIYDVGYRFKLGDGRKISGNTVFGIFKNPDNFSRPAGSAAVPPEIRSITPEMNEILISEPSVIKFNFGRDVSVKEASAAVSWKNSYFGGYASALAFFALAFIVNVFVLYKGVEGIETLASAVMPAFLAFIAILVVRLLTLPDLNAQAFAGAAALWSFDSGVLLRPEAWLAAAGQVLFALCVCKGAISAFSSFLNDNDDAELSRVKTGVSGILIEIILAFFIVVPAAIISGGMGGAEIMAKNGATGFGFLSMPLFFSRIPLGNALGALWFLLLFLTGVIASASLAYPAVLFLKEEAGYSHGKAAGFTSFIMFIASAPAALYYAGGFVAELDFIVGVCGFALLGLVEFTIFYLAYGTDSAWNEPGCCGLPGFFYYVIKYVTPVFIFGLIAAWAFYGPGAVVSIKPASAAVPAAVWSARAVAVCVFLIFTVLVKSVWNKKKA